MKGRKVMDNCPKPRDNGRVGEKKRSTGRTGEAALKRVTAIEVHLASASLHSACALCRPVFPLLLPALSLFVVESRPRSGVSRRRCCACLSAAPLNVGLSCCERQKRCAEVGARHGRGAAPLAAQSVPGYSGKSGSLASWEVDSNGVGKPTEKGGGFSIAEDGAEW